MSKIKNIPTKKIKEILNNHYNLTNIGTDYGQYKDELQQELWRRQDKNNTLMIERSIERYNRQG